MSFRFFSFSVLIASSAILGHLYLYRRLVRGVVGNRALRLMMLVALVLLTLLLVFRRMLQRSLSRESADVVAVVSYTWMGVALCLVLVSLAVDLGRWLTALARRLRAPLEDAPREPPRVDEGRRLLLARAVAGGAVAVGGGMAAYGSWRAFAPPEVTELTVKIPKLPKALDGLSIVQLSDTHVGPFIQRKFMDELVRRANALRPDLVVITGDLVDGDVPTLGRSVAALRNLEARFGCFFVTGNHDYSSGDEAWTAFLEKMGLQVLRNRRVSLGDGGGTLDLVGVDDWSGGRRRGKQGYDLDRALAGRDPDRAAVLLAHQPANFEVAAKRGVDLQLSGHTHGGQLFPMTLFIGLGWEHSAGLYRYGDAHIYVSRGCGFWGPPMRLGSPPELVRVVLTA